MKNIFCLSLILITFFTSCRNESTERQLINEAEAILQQKPDSAYMLLDSITMADNLSDKLLARWCMLYGKAADKVYKDMPYVSQLKRARTWYEKHGTPYEQAQIGLYLGRSYVEDREYMKAMDAYVQALDVAEKAKEYNVAGYICSYMGDLYELKDMSMESSKKYHQASDYFLRADNKRSHALALRDMARTQAYQDSCTLALEYLLKADSIVLKLNDTEAIASIKNGLGNVYAMLKDTAKAEYYFFNALAIDSLDVAPTYLALCNLYLNKDINKARLYLDKAKFSNSKSSYTSVAIIHKQYELDKKENNLEFALSHLEEYQSTLDSIYNSNIEDDILDIEKRYNHLKILDENNRLRNKNLINIILLNITIVISLIIYSIYQHKNKNKNKRIYEQEKKLNELNNELERKKRELCVQESLKSNENKLNEIVNEISNVKNELFLIRKQKLFSSTIAKKITKLSKNVVAGSDQPLLSYKDWNSIKKLINETYPYFIDILKSVNYELTLSEEQYCYLSFFELDIRAESILLNINLDSVIKRRYRIRQKLNIVGEDIALYNYFVDKM